MRSPTLGAQDGLDIRGYQFMTGLSSAGEKILNGGCSGALPERPRAIARRQIGRGPGLLATRFYVGGGWRNVLAAGAMDGGRGAQLQLAAIVIP